MANIFIVVNETIGPNETVPVTLTPVRCRNCKRELPSRADFECVAVPAPYTTWVSVLYSSSPSLFNFLPLSYFRNKTLILMAVLSAITRGVIGPLKIV